MSDKDNLITSKEVAYRAGVSIETLRLYRKRGFLSDPVIRPPSGGSRGWGGVRRVGFYPPGTVEKVLLIKLCKKSGLADNELRQRLKTKGWMNDLSDTLGLLVKRGEGGADNYRKFSEVALSLLDTLSLSAKNQEKVLTAVVNLFNGLTEPSVLALFNSLNQQDPAVRYLLNLIEDSYKQLEEFKKIQKEQTKELSSFRDSVQRVRSMVRQEISELERLREKAEELLGGNG